MMRTTGPCRSSAGEQRLRVLGQISRSNLFGRYQSAFQEATGLTLHLATTGGDVVGGKEGLRRNGFCMLLHLYDGQCEECCRIWRKMAAFGDAEIHHFTCFAGLCESCVAIRNGSDIIGLLIAGEAATSRLTRAKFDAIVTRLKLDGREFDEERLRRAYFSTRTITRKQYESFLDLLEVFAGHLSLVANQISLHESDVIDPEIRRAREFIHNHLGEQIALKDVARSANLSACYFSTKFRESTGLSFTQYVATARVEEAKKLLAAPCIRISEIAFAVGFQSLTHFNRVFKNITGASPTRFREACAGAAPAP